MTDPVGSKPNGRRRQFPTQVIRGVLKMKLSGTIKFAIPAVVGILTLGMFTPAAFATTTVNTTMAVSATVASSCTISASALAFGAYTGAALPATSTITVTCTSTTPYNVGLGAGAGKSATVTTRSMTGAVAGNSLPYTLTSGSTSGPNWGATVGTDTVQGTGIGTAQSLKVYGNIPAGANVAPDTYNDTITASVIY
jgi:spore coat protein U-like protein